MTILEFIEESISQWEAHDSYSKTLITFATLIGLAILFIHTIKFILACIRNLRLYMFRQICCHDNLREKYGQWAVVTGSTDGIGLSIAKELARRGHSIVVVGRNQEKLEATKQALEQEPNVGEVLTVKIDLSEAKVENFQRLKSEIDPDNKDIGILVNNAGTFPAEFRRFASCDIETAKNVVNVNVFATVMITRMIMPSMVARNKGLVVNVSSILGSVPAPFFNVYGSSKAFVDAFSVVLQMEYSSHSLDIINLAPGAVFTKLFKNSTIVPRPSVFNPTPEDYAKSAVNTFSSGMHSISGTYFHAVNHWFADLSNMLGLVPTMFKLNMRYNAKDYNLSPIPKRKSAVATSNS